MDEAGGPITTREMRDEDLPAVTALLRRGRLLFVGRRRSMLVHGVDANSLLATDDSQQSLIMHGVEQMCGCVRCSSPIVPDRTVREMCIHLLRMHLAAFAHEVQEQHRLFPLRRRPRKTSLCQKATVRPRMHQRLHFPGHEAVIDEEVLFDPELDITPLQVAGPIVLHSVAQDEVLGGALIGSERINGSSLHTFYRA